MAPVTVSLTIPEAEVADTKAAAMSFTGLPSTATAKELLAEVANKVVKQWRSEQALKGPSPGIT